MSRLSARRRSLPLFVDVSEIRKRPSASRGLLFSKSMYSSATFTAKLAKQEAKHKCALSKTDPKAYLNNLPKNATFLRIWTQLIVVSTIDPRTKIYYRSSASLDLERRRHILKPALHIIHPFSVFRNIWEHWMMFVFTVSLVVIPLDLLYHGDDDTQFSGMAPLSSFIDFACLIDILVSFFTGLHADDTKEVILSQKGIAKGYLSSMYFYMDFISSIPSDVISAIVHRLSEQVWEVRVLKCLSLIKIFRARTVFQRITLTAEMFNLNQNMIRGIKYLLMAAMIIHWVGCLTYIIPTYWLSFSKLTKYEDPNTDDFTKYLDGVFKAVSYFLCIRMHQNVIFEEIDLVLGIAISILGRFGLAILIILFVQIFENLISTTTKYHEIVNQLESYMRHRQLPIDIQKRLITYYEYRFQKTYFRETEITSFLSRNIIQQINLYCYRNLVEKVSILKILPPETINEIISKLKCEFYLPKDTIVKSGETGDCMYFLASGTVCVFSSSGKEICHLESGAYFGEISLISSETKRIADVIAIEICEIYRLDKRSFKRLMQQDEFVAEKVQNLSSIRTQQTKLIDEMHKKLIMTKLDKEKMKELSLQSNRNKNLVGRPLNVKWNSKLWRNTFSVHQA